MTKSERPDLIDALLALNGRAEAQAFLADLCTPGEVRALSERWQVAPGGSSRRSGGCSRTTRELVARRNVSVPGLGQP